mgnify:FL=1
MGAAVAALPQKRQAADAEPSLRIMQNECAECKRQRKSKHRVASGKKDARFTEAKFAAAHAVFPNNDIKYNANKKRSLLYAQSKGEAVTYSQAKDTPSQDALREKPGIAAEKLKWLQRHDRECGDLYGMLPLIHNMPMALTDHLDRSPDKQLLRGKICYLHSWALHKDEKSTYANGARVLDKLPVAVFVKFPGAKWTLPGLTEEGLYPIKPKTSSWYLDKGRQHPVLRISRKQLPLAPAFAITAHAAQGQTLDAAIVDLQIGRGTSPIASYVALTRVKRREDILIYRPFDRDLFTKGSPRGPELLMKTLRNEDVDWRAIEEEFTPHARCIRCGFSRFKDGYIPAQWNRKDKRRHCKPCMDTLKKAGTPFECNVCNL